MNLYIEIENGQPKNHPAFEDNLIQAFGSVPENWENFVRVERPKLDVYQVLDADTPTYLKIDGVWTDVWSLRNMTPEEKAFKQQTTIEKFNAREQFENWSAWVLDEVTCTMIPPIPRPQQNQTKIDSGIFTVWCGAENNWKDTPSKPVDGNQYKFDFFAWQWVQVVN